MRKKRHEGAGSTGHLTLRYRGISSEWRGPWWNYGGTRGRGWCEEETKDWSRLRKHDAEEDWGSHQEEDSTGLERSDWRARMGSLCESENGDTDPTASFRVCGKGEAASQWLWEETARRARFNQVEESWVAWHSLKKLRGQLEGVGQEPTWVLERDRLTGRGRGSQWKSEGVECSR